MSVLERAKKDGAKIHLKTAGINIMGGERDLESVTELDDGEKILCVVTGKLVQISNDRSRGIGTTFGSRQATGTDSKGVLVVTDKKVIFKDKRLLGSQTTVIEGDEVNSISTSKGLISAKIVIKTPSGTYDLTDVRKDATSDAVSALNQLKSSKSRASGGTTGHQASSGMEEIKKAKTLLDEGIISKEEFDQIKKKHL